MKINFVVKEYIGNEIYKIPDEILYNLDDIKIGDEILVLGFTGLIPMIVDSDRSATSKDGKLSAVLSFAEDDRMCWTCCGLVNMNAIKKLTKTIEIGK